VSAPLLARRLARGRSRAPCGGDRRPREYSRSAVRMPLGHSAEQPASGAQQRFGEAEAVCERAPRERSLSGRRFAEGEAAGSVAVLAGDAAAPWPHRQALRRRRQRRRGRRQRPRERAWQNRSRPGTRVGATRTRQPRVRGGGSAPLPASARTQCALLQRVSHFRVPCTSPYPVEPCSFRRGLSPSSLGRSRARPRDPK
jgi:hypothetical protein